MPRDNSNSEELLLEAPYDAGSGGMEIRASVVGWLRWLWPHRSLVARLVFAALLLSTVLAFVIPTRYDSTARLMPPDQDSGTAAMMAAVMGRFGETAGGLGEGLLGMKTSGDLFSGVLRSRTVQDDLVSKFDLLKVYRTRRREDARQKLAERTGVSIDRKSGIMTITVTDHQPERAQAIVLAYIDDLNQMMTQLNTSSARREREFLEQRLAQVQTSLEDAEKQFSEFASKNTAIDIEAQGKAMIGAAANLEGQLIAAQTELESLRQMYSDNNVRVRAVQARVNELQRQVQKLGGDPTEANTADKPDDHFVYPTIRKLPLLGVSYADLYRTMKVQDAVLASLTQQYEIAKVEEAKEIPSVKVLDQPDLPEKKSYPPRAEIMLLGTCLGAILAVSLVTMKDHWNRLDPEDPTRAFTQEVMLGVRSRVHAMSDNVAQIRKAAGRNGSANGNHQAAN
jgi:capsule polysaccharide export protein KpsE/RkpR